ncbi:MAG: ABC transporter permease [Planctomycetota bacterium]|nr:ABC transporter permease [Planctomycetota bacterium]
MSTDFPATPDVAKHLAASPVNPWRAAWALTRREWIRFIRQRNRVVGSLGQPLIFWLLFGAGLGPSFRLPGATDGLSYREYFFPGTLVLILLFTAIFATISIIEDRREGFLQSVLVAPVPRWSMVLGKILGGTLIALAAAVIFLLLGLTTDIPLGVGSFLAAIAFLFFIGLGLTALGFCIAWRMSSTQGFHAVMSLFLMPMWLLSGSFFPPGDNWIGWIVRLNPLTYGVAGLRRILYSEGTEAARQAALPVDLPGAWMSGVVSIIFVVAMLILAWRVAAVRTAGDLQ